MKIIRFLGAAAGLAVLGVVTTFGCAWLYWQIVGRA